MESSVPAIPPRPQGSEAEPCIGLPLACDVAERKVGDSKTARPLMDQGPVLRWLDNPGADEIAAEVGARMERVRDNLTKD